MWVLTKGGPANATQVLELYVYNTGFRANLTGLASAVSVVLFLATGILIFFLFRVRRNLEMEGT